MGEVKIKLNVEFTISEAGLEDAFEEYDELTVEGVIRELLDTVFTPDAQATAATMRERGVFVVPLQGAVRVALCSTPASEVPRLVEALTEGVAAAGG